MFFLLLFLSLYFSSSYFSPRKAVLGLRGVNSKKIRFDVQKNLGDPLLPSVPIFFVGKIKNA